MIITEHGLTFTRHGDSWRCAEHAELRMYADGSFGLDDDPQRYPSAAAALASRTGVRGTESPPRRRRSR